MVYYSSERVTYTIQTSGARMRRRASRQNKCSMCCTETQRYAQAHLLNISWLIAQFGRSHHHVYEPVGRCKMVNIVDVSSRHEASTIDTSQTIIRLCYKSKRDRARQVY